MEQLSSVIGRRIFDLRIERDVQQGELANAIKIHQSVLNRIEKGSRPARDTEIRDIAMFFEVSADYLLGVPAPPTIAKVISDDAHPIDNDAADLKDVTPLTSENNQLRLSPEERDLLLNYRKLDRRGKHAVDDTLQRELSYSL